MSPALNHQYHPVLPLPHKWTILPRNCNHITAEAGRKWGYKEQTPTLTPGGSLTSEWHKPDVVCLRVSDEKASHLQGASCHYCTALIKWRGKLLLNWLSLTHRCIQKKCFDTHVVLFYILYFDIKLEIQLSFLSSRPVLLCLCTCLWFSLAWSLSLRLIGHPVML